MVVYILYLQADQLQGVQSVEWAHNAALCVSVRNPTEPAMVRERVVIDCTAGLHQDVPTHDAHKAHVPHSPPHVHHTAKKQHAAPPCHLQLHWPCDTGPPATVRVLEADEGKKKLPALQSSLTVSGMRTPMLALQCEKVEPYALHWLGQELVVKASAGSPAGITTYTDLEWDNNGDAPCSWSAYDMVSGSTSITNLRAVFE